MWRTYATVAVTFLVIGFVLCAILSTNTHSKEFVVDNLLESEDEDE